jgi:iron complex outermembrane receptor protein
MHHPLVNACITPLLLTCLAAGTIISAANGYAASAAENDLGTFMVTATRTVEPIEKIGRSTEVITREQIENSPATDLYEVLEYTSGIDIQRRNGGTQADVSIRGGGFEQTLVLLNGISMSNPQTGHHNMDVPVQLQDIERIEVIKGPGAHIYGANAMAGVINIITRAPESTEVELHLEGGEHDYYNAGANASFKTHTWNHRLSAAQRYSSGFESSEPTGFNIKSLNTQSTADLGTAELDIGAGYIDKDFGASRFYFDAPEQKEQTRTLTGYAKIDGYTGTWHWEPHISYQRHEDIYKYAAGGQWYTNDSTTNKMIAQLNADTRTRLGTSFIGISAEWEEMESTSLGDHERNQRSVVFNQRIPVGSRIEAGAGISAVDYSDWGWEYWPGLDVNVELSDRWSWFASFGESFRIPTYTEMYYNTPMNIGNPELKPEEAQTWESGIRGAWRNISMEVALFRRESDNLIEWVRTTPQQPWYVANIAETTTTGVETEISIRSPFGDTEFVEQIKAAYAYLDTDMRNSNLETKYTLNHLRHQFHLSADLKWNPALRQHIIYRYEKRLAGDNAGIVDMRLSWDINRSLSLNLSVTNLFDTDYIEAGFAPAPGRWIRGGLSWRI